MPEPIYYIKLFYGDMKFTNDYSNVLQFDNKTTRDNYFNSMSDFVDFNNVEFNSVMFEGGSVKVVIPKENLAIIDNINYCYIDFALVGENGYEQKRKYYFVNSYNIVSSSEDVTVIAFNLEYDIWQNHQFDFTLRECSIERSHMDRWNVDGTLKYKRPLEDSFECNMEIENSQVENSQRLPFYQENTLTEKDILWVVVTASHTIGSRPDTIYYHIFPVAYKSNEIYGGMENDIDSETFYYRNSCKFCPVAVANKNLYYPSLECLPNARLMFACGVPSTGSSDDAIKILNIEIFTYLPLTTELGDWDLLGETTIHNCMRIKFNNEYLPIVYVPTLFSPTDAVYVSAVIPDLTVFTKMKDDYQKYKVFDMSYPSKPVNLSVYSETYEPMLYVSPIRQKFLVANDNTAMATIPNKIMYDLIDRNVTASVKNKISFEEQVSYSGISGYNYYIISGYTREELNTLGFAFNKITYLYTFINDEFINYCMTQRDSDRAMMWTNIATGGLAEGGSTAVSAGIGWRSNTERAKMMGYSSDFAKNMAAYNKHSVKIGVKSNGQPNYAQRNPALRHFYESMDTLQYQPAKDMYAGMAHNAMMMSGIGGITAFSANAIHQGMAQREKERAIRNTPATLASAGNVESSIINNQMSVSFVQLKCDPTTYEKYKTLFIKYGYYLGTVELPNIKSRKFFNYIKTNGAMVTGSCNQLILSYIANIFDTGVTIWHMDYTTYATIYDYTKENIERSLM